MDNETIISGRPPVKTESLEGIKTQIDRLSFTNGKLDVNASVTGASGGTSAVDKSAFTVGTDSQTPIGGIYQASPDTITDGKTAAVGIDANRALKVHITANDVSSSGGTSSVDGATYSAGVSQGTPFMGAVDDTSTSSAAEDKIAIARITPQRGVHVNLRNQSGTEIGTASTPVQVSLANTAANSTAVKVDASSVAVPVTDNSGSLTVDNAGTFAVQAAQSGTWNITNVSGTVSLPTGAATAAKQPALGTAGTPSADVITVQGVTSMTALKVDGSAVTQPVSISGNQAVNVAQINGVTPLMGNGASGTGAQRVTIANDSTGKLATVDTITNVVHVDDNSGSLTVDGTVTANLAPTTSGGLTTYHLASTGSTNATVVKNSAGQLYGWYIYNSNAAARKLAFHNASTTPTAGASIFFSIVIPPASAANVEFTQGIPFSTGISITTVTDLADSGTTAVAANDLIINLFYK